MTKKIVKSKEPAWMDPANDRKTPYTEEELDLFVDGFIKSNEEAWEELATEMGDEKARNVIKDGFRKQDERHISNINAENKLIH